MYSNLKKLCTEELAHEYLPNNQNKKLTTKTKNFKHPKQPRNAILIFQFIDFFYRKLPKIMDGCHNLIARKNELEAS